MPKLRWTPQALRDVQRLYRFLVATNPDAARRAASAIRNGVRVLEQQPALGRPVHGMPSEFREWLVDFGRSGYLVRYRNDGEAVVLLAVRHHREAGYD